MKNKTTILLFLQIILFYPFVSGQNVVYLIKTDSARYQLIVKKEHSSDSIIKRMNYGIFKFRKADMDGDGHEDIIIGAIKRTIYDTSISKRINLWKIENGAIMPMWLGSKMPHPLFDFEIKKEEPIPTILTIEYEKSRLYLVAEYKWHSFGLKFIRYIQREITLDSAYQTLNNEL